MKGAVTAHAKRAKHQHARTTTSPRRQIGAYTVLFVLVALICFLPFIINGKSFIWAHDGIRQHYVALQYMGMWLREIATGGTLAVPLWDHTIGYGSDILTTLAYYVLGDPLNYLSAIVPMRYTEYLYDALIVVRLYLAGLFFIIYCRHMKCSGHGGIAGALAYVFCGWVLYASVRHPFFINPIVYLPLILTGIERVLDGRSPVLFTVMMALAALSNFYFLYIIVLLIVIYFIIRFATLEENRSIGRFFKLLVGFVLCSLVGFMIAGALLLPTVNAFLETSRASATSLHDPLYSPLYYQTLIASLGTSAGFKWTTIGVSAPVLLGIPLLLANRGHRGLKIGLAVLFVFLLFPIFGSIFNGMSYVTNRWSWAFPFLLAFIIATLWDSFVRPSRRELAFMLCGSIVYAVVFLFLGEGVSENSTAALALMFGALAIIAFMGFRQQDAGGGTRPADARSERPHVLERLCEPAWRQRIVVALVIVGICVNAVYKYNPHEENYISDFMDTGTAYETIHATPFERVASYMEDDGEFSRVSMDMNSLWRNATCLAGTPSTSYFWSLSSGTISEYLADLEIPDHLSQKYTGLDRRAFPLALACVKYYVAPTDGVSGSFAPYGFEEVEGRLEKSSYKTRVYENAHFLPFGYSYAGYITQSELDAMDAPHKQDALMQAVAVPDDAALPLEHATVESGIEQIDATVELGEGLEWADSETLVVAEKGASLTINASIPAGKEAYVYIKGLKPLVQTPYQLYHDGNEGTAPQSEFDGLSTIERNELLYEDLMSSDWQLNSTNLVDVLVSCGEARSKVVGYSDYYIWNEGQNDNLVNLGCSGRERSSITMQFTQPGTYKVEGIGVLAQPLDDYQAQVEALGEDALEDVKFGTNAVSGSFSTDRAKAVLVAIPYSKGWTASVDGEAVEPLRANEMFMALTVEPGTHQIELRYETPMLKLGLACTAAGLVILVCMAFASRARRRRSASRSRSAASLG